MTPLVIEVRGGIAKPSLPLPDTMKVIIRDYDCSQFESHELRQDANGVDFVELIYAGEGLIDSSVMTEPSSG